tara:strand:+ start:254 stop:1204 length:951 start_codon:yes stop_codon:yes gene_type:complete
MGTLKDLAGDQTPVTAYPKSIQFGPVTLDGYMLENGEFRQSINSTAASIGIKNSEITRFLSGDNRWNSQAKLPFVDAGTANPLQDNGFGSKMQENTGAVIQPVKALGGIRAYTINLPMVVEIWKKIALGGGKYSKQALELLGLSAVHSLERTYQEAFGIGDSRSTNDRLLDWAIRLDTGKHFPLFGGQFHQHFARVTGVALGHRYAQVCLAELVYHRLPEPIYETLKDLNPLDERGWRQFSHSQLMTDDMRQQMREIVSAVTSQLANTPSKADDSKAYKRCLHRLDKTLPRYKTRKGNIDNMKKAITAKADISDHE